jgi:hypothetical protein
MRRNRQQIKPHKSQILRADSSRRRRPAGLLEAQSRLGFDRCGVAAQGSIEAMTAVIA